MANANTFGAQYIQAVTSLINDLENLRVLHDRLTQDGTLFAGYVAAPGARTDLVAQDLATADAAVVQMLFTFDSGNPTQKAALFKLL